MSRSQIAGLSTLTALAVTFIAYLTLLTVAVYWSLT